jgi:hypothetical protein
VADGIASGRPRAVAGGIARYAAHPRGDRTCRALRGSACRRTVGRVVGSSEPLTGTTPGSRLRSPG